MILDDILNNTDYKLSQFPGSYVDDLINRSYEKTVRGKRILYTNCLVRNKPIQLKPEEVVRQLFLELLNKNMGTLTIEW